MKLKWSSLLTGMVLGSIGTAAIGTVAAASADGFQVSLADVKLLINGVDKTNGGSFFNGETNVPVAFTFGDSTYVPLRYVSQALGYAVNWDQNSKTITIGSGSQSPPSGSFANNQKFVPPGRQGLGDIAYLSSDVYSGTDSDLLVVKLAYENADTNTWNFGNYAVSFRRSDGSTYSSASNLPANSEANVDPKTSRVVAYSASVPKGSKASDYKMLLSNYDFSQQPAAVSQLAAAQLTDSTTSANLFNAGDTANVSLAPYSLSFTATQNLGTSRGQATQSYQANIAYSKPGGAVS
ncbi:MAG: superoxide dismutase copper/zinc binding protein, partial [Bacilli bacterium]|nr:superoxide dismutase copper/zinc binding protein [Bacilli bacterium]